MIGHIVETSSLVFSTPKDPGGGWVWGFVRDILSNFLGGAVIAAVGYFIIERRLSLRAEKKNRQEISHDILGAIHDELKHNEELANTMIENLPKGGLPYSGFELSGWSLISQVPAFTVVDPAVTKALLDAYLRLRSANEQHALLFDFMYGATGTLSYLIAGTSPTPEGRANFRRFNERREDLRQRLLHRVGELPPYVGSALAAVEAELEEAKKG